MSLSISIAASAENGSCFWLFWSFWLILTQNEAVQLKLLSVVNTRVHLWPPERRCMTTVEEITFKDLTDGSVKSTAICDYTMMS
jgi:hypothetical protein